MRSYDFFLKPGPGEQTQASIPLPKGRDAVIAGEVTGENGPESGVLVLLMDQETGELLAHTVTDSLGRFWFGPVASGVLYALRAQKADGAVRLVELTGLEP